MIIEPSNNELSLIFMVEFGGMKKTIAVTLC